MATLKYIMYKFILINIILFFIIYGFIVNLRRNTSISNKSNISREEIIGNISISNKSNISGEGIIDKANSLTIDCNEGALGNQMCTYAVLRGLSAFNNRSMSVMPCNLVALKPYFDLNIPVVNIATFQPRHAHIIYNNYLENRDLNISSETNIIKGYPDPCSFTYFNYIRKTITRDFIFKIHIRKYAKNALLKIKAGRTNVTFVGIHVRRTDYLLSHNASWLKAFEGREVDMDYFVKATQYYTSKYQNALFVAVSDDRNWCKVHLTNLGIHVMENVPSPAHDMAILAQCNHTIMTYGTFGFWGSYLAGGEVIYFDKFLSPNSPFLAHNFQFENMYLPEWIGISTNSSFI